VFRIPDAIAAEVWAYLNHREKDGYTLRTEDVYSQRDGEEVVIEKDVSHACRPCLGLLSVLAGGSTVATAAAVAPFGAEPDCRRRWIKG